MSSHQMATVEEYCENLLILNRGKTILKGNLREIKSGYGRTRLAVNTSPRNRRGRSRAGTGAGGNPRGLYRIQNQLGRVRPRLFCAACWNRACIRRAMKSRNRRCTRSFSTGVGGTEEDAKR